MIMMIMMMIMMINAVAHMTTSTSLSRSPLIGHAVKRNATICKTSYKYDASRRKPHPPFPTQDVTWHVRVYKCNVR